MDDAVGGADVGGGDAGAADAHGLAADADADALAVECLDRAALDDLGRGQFAPGDVVEQDRAQLRLAEGPGDEVELAQRDQAPVEPADDVQGSGGARSWSISDIPRWRATERYVKLLPQPEERSPADRLHAYVARAADRAGW